jgi:molecular chaperone HscA
MTKHKGVLEVLATSGDTSLGGDDFDCIIGDIIAEQVGGNALNFKHIAKDIKQYLTDHPQWSGDIMGKPCMVKRSDFVSRAASLVSRTASLLMHALADAAVVAEDLAEVILVGGATRMPIIKETLHLLLKRDILDSLDPDKTVAIGAALQAYNLVSRSGDLLLDVTPLSLKLELADGSADTIIPRNSAIPANASRVFTTHVDGQAGFVLKILQGESVMASGCRVLGEYELSGIPKMPAGTARLEVTFQIDADGILLVHAEEKISGITQEVMLKPSFGLTAENMMRF